MHKNKVSTEQNNIKYSCVLKGIQYKKSSSHLVQHALKRFFNERGS